MAVTLSSPHSCWVIPMLQTSTQVLAWLSMVERYAALCYFLLPVAQACNPVHTFELARDGCLEGALPVNRAVVAMVDGAVVQLPALLSAFKQDSSSLPSDEARLQTGMM